LEQATTCADDLPGDPARRVASEERDGITKIRQHADALWPGSHTLRTGSE
jgi:hypothetical protein